MLFEPMDISLNRPTQGASHRLGGHFLTMPRPGMVFHMSSCYCYTTTLAAFIRSVRGVKAAGRCAWLVAWRVAAALHRAPVGGIHSFALVTPRNSCRESDWDRCPWTESRWCFAWWCARHAETSCLTRSYSSFHQILPHSDFPFALHRSTLAVALNFIWLNHFSR